MRPVIAAVIAVVTAAACIRLGVWQLDRLEQRRALNAVVESRLLAAPVAPDEVPADTGEQRYRRVAVTGSFDFEHQIVLPARMRQGSPGVNILTPVRPTSGGRAVLVNRGWVYSPDANTVDLSRWREAEPASIEGFVEPLAPPGASAATLRRAPDSAQVARAVPYPVAPYYVAATSVASSSEGAERRDVPVRLSPPALDDGPHRGYAFQWFSFAAIVLVGVPILLWHEARRQRRG